MPVWGRVLKGRGGAKAERCGMTVAEIGVNVDSVHSSSPLPGSGIQQALRKALDNKHRIKILREKG